MGKLTVKLVLVVAILLGAGELLARALIMSPSPQIYDPALGFAYAPNVEVFWGIEGFARNRYNSLGLNNDEIGPKSQRRRVLVIGDSYVEARHVPRAENFVSIAQRADGDVEIINAGRDGLNVASFPVFVDRLTPKLKPDLVVVVLSQARLLDFTDTKVVIKGNAAGNIIGVRYLIEPQDRIKEEVGTVLRHSALLTALAYRYKGYLFDELHSLRDLAASPALAFFGAPAHSATPQPRGATVPPEEVLAFVLRQIRAEAPVAVLYLPHLAYQADGTADEAPASALVSDIMRQMAAREHIPFVSAREEFREAYRATTRPLQGFSNTGIFDGHLNPVGHAALGRALARLLRTEAGPES